MVGMENNKYFNLNNAKELEVPEGLKIKILSNIKAAQKEKIRRKKRFFVAGFLLLLVLLIFSGTVFGRQIIASEFWSLARLGFTDSKIVLEHWSEFSWSLLETLPTMSLVGILTPVLLLLILLKKYGEQEMLFKFKNN